MDAVVINGTSPAIAPVAASPTGCQDGGHCGDSRHDSSGSSGSLKEKRDLDINIAVMGASGVGKTALIVRFLTRRFIGDYDHQSEYVYSHQLMIDGKETTVHIMDTSWDIVDDDKRLEQINWCDGFLLVYDITEQSTYDFIKDAITIVHSVRQHDHVPMTLVGNKCDLLHRRTVPGDAAQSYATQHNCLFQESSASEDFKGVERLFVGLCRDIRHVYRRKAKLKMLLQKPSVVSKLQTLRQGLKCLKDMKWPTRTPTM